MAGSPAPLNRNPNGVRTVHLEDFYYDSVFFDEATATGAAGQTCSVSLNNSALSGLNLHILSVDILSSVDATINFVFGPSSGQGGGPIQSAIFPGGASPAGQIRGQSLLNGIIPPSGKLVSVNANVWFRWPFKHRVAIVPPNQQWFLLGLTGVNTVTAHIRWLELNF